MTFKRIFLSISILGLVISCNNNEPEEDNIFIPDTTSILVDTISIDTTSVLPDSLLEEGYVDETAEISNIIEKKYGEQWDFCDCVVKSDSINKVFENADDLTEAEFDAAFARMEVIDGHCVELLTTPNTTPEERSKHERKVKKCLKNAKK